MIVDDCPMDPRCLELLVEISRRGSIRPDPVRHTLEASPDAFAITFADRMPAADDRRPITMKTPLTPLSDTPHAVYLG